MKKKLLSLALALALCLGLAVPAFAAEVRIVKVPVPTVEEYEGVEYSTWEFHEGLSKLYLYEDSSGSSTGTGFVDWTGKVIIAPGTYDGAMDFSEGFAAVYKNGKWGFIDKTGKEVVPFSYEAAQKFSEGMAAVMKNNKIGFVDAAGKEVIPCAYSNSAEGFSQGLAAVEKGGKWGFIDKTGEVVIDFTYDGAYSFSEGLAAVEKNGKMGFIDKTGKEAFPFEYDSVYPFSEGLAVVAKNNKGGYINKTGELVIPLQYDFSKEFSNGLAPVMKNNKWGYINKEGEQVVPFKYGNAEAFSEGFAAVYSEAGGSWGFIDTTGKEVIPAKTYTENGVEYNITPAIYKVPIAFHGGSVWIRRYLQSGSQDNYVPTVYFKLTVDAKVADWAREQVDLAAAKGLMPDCLGDDFTVNITRAEFAAVAVELYEAMGGETAPAPGENPFSDTTDPVVLQANALGIVKGSGGKFSPDNPVTRQEAALMLSRVYTRLGGQVPTVAATTFADNGYVASWARDAVAFMSDNRIVNGKGSNKFDPLGNASIQEALIIALRMVENLDME